MKLTNEKNYVIMIGKLISISEKRNSLNKKKIELQIFIRIYLRFLIGWVTTISYDYEDWHCLKVRNKENFMVSLTITVILIRGPCNIYRVVNQTQRQNSSKER